MWYKVKEWYDSHQLSLLTTYNIPLLIFFIIYRKSILKTVESTQFSNAQKNYFYGFFNSLKNIYWKFCDYDFNLCSGLHFYSFNVKELKSCSGSLFYKA